MGVRCNLTVSLALALSPENLELPIKELHRSVLVILLTLNPHNESDKLIIISLCCTRMRHIGLYALLIDTKGLL